MLRSLSQTLSFFTSPRRRSRRNPALTPTPVALESLENRQLLSAVNALSDEFDDASSLSDWQRINETEGWNADQLAQWDIDGTRAGQMTMMPHTASWYQNWRGPLVYKEVSGDFVITTQVEITDRDDVGDSDADDVPNGGTFSLGGIMIRTPRDIFSPADWTPGSMVNDGTNSGENYVFFSLGHGFGTDNNGFFTEVKTTRNSNSQLELTSHGPDANTITLQTARIGSSVIVLYQLPGHDWQVHRRFHRPDMPETLQAGMVTYTDFDKVSAFDPFYHNGNVLMPDGFDPNPGQPFSPDLNAGFDYARFAAPDVPEGLAGVDLVTEATDEQLLSFLGDHANVPAGDTDPADPVEVPVIDHQSMIRSDDFLSIALPDTVNGDVVDYDAVIVENVAADLNAAHNPYFFLDDYGLNWGGFSEKWLQSDSGYVYLLPDGSVYLWGGSFAASSLLADLPDSFYADPTLLTEVNAVDVSLSFDAAGLTVDPAPDYAGTFRVALSATVAGETQEQLFEVSVTNSAPTISPIADQHFAAGGGPVLVNLTADDVDGDSLTFSAKVVGSEAAELRIEHGLYDAELNNYGLNWGGQQEKWIQGNSGWYFLLPDGTLNQWAGSFDSSVAVGSPGTEFYDDPSLLLTAEVSEVDLQLTGDVLTIAGAQETGEFEISVTATDGVASASTTFSLLVSNNLPEFTVGDQMVGTEQVLSFDLPAQDADGQTIVYSADVLGSQEQALQAEHGFHSDGEYHINWGGQNEKWIRDAGNAWHYLLPDGGLYRWTGSFAASELVAGLDWSVYADPALLTEPLESDVAASVSGNTIQLTGGVQVSTVTVRITASDGMSTVVRYFSLDVFESEIDDLFASFDGV